MMAAATSKPRPFDILVMSEESRLGREMIAVAYAFKTLVVAGIKILYYMEDRERTLDSPSDKILMAITSFAAELEREMARSRARDASLQRASPRLRERQQAVRLSQRPERERARRVRDRSGSGSSRSTHLRDGSGREVVQEARRRAQRRGLSGATRARLTTGTVRGIVGNQHFRGQLMWGRKTKRDKWGPGESVVSAGDLVAQDRRAAPQDHQRRALGRGA
jgi:DNA invertase Pin-like site-specific DNA recombinase